MAIDSSNPPRRRRRCDFASPSWRLFRGAEVRKGLLLSFAASILLAQDFAPAAWRRDHTFELANSRTTRWNTHVKSKLLHGALVLYIMAIAVTALTNPAKRIYWPLYLPIIVMAAVILAARRS